MTDRAFYLVGVFIFGLNFGFGVLSIANGFWPGLGSFVLCGVMLPALRDDRKRAMKDA